MSHNSRGYQSFCIKHTKNKFWTVKKFVLDLPRPSKIEAGGVQNRAGRFPGCFFFVHCSEEIPKSLTLQVFVGKMANVAPIWALLGSIWKPWAAIWEGLGGQKCNPKRTQQWDYQKWCFWKEKWDLVHKSCKEAQKKLLKKPRKNWGFWRFSFKRRFAKRWKWK